MGLDVAAAQSRLRLLQTNLGGPGRDLYAYQAPSGQICFVLLHASGACTTSIGTPDFSWTIGAGETPDSPSDLAGVATDQVTAVALTVDGTAVPVSLEHNVVYAEFAPGAQQASLDVKYSIVPIGRVSWRLTDPAEVNSTRKPHLEGGEVVQLRPQDPVICCPDTHRHGSWSL